MNNHPSDSAIGGSPAYEPKPNPQNPTVRSINNTTLNTTKPLRPPTRKETAFARYLVDNPTATITEAYQAVYNSTSQNKPTVHSEASKTMSKPQVKLELAKYSAQAESTLVEVMNYSKELGKSGNGAGAAYAGVASSNANSLLDRVHGKATQRVEQHTTSVALNIDLTSVIPPDI